MSGYEESERAVGDDGLVLCGDWLRRGARRLCGACANGWRDDEPVDGARLPLRAHAESLAAHLVLDESQRSALVAELRNALVPALDDAERRGAERAAKQIERVLALADAIRRQM